LVIASAIAEPKKVDPESQVNQPIPAIEKIIYKLVGYVLNGTDQNDGV
jgi:hypothetical protein